jgi:hypothetical protein
VEPVLGRQLFLPFLLSALDPAAVNQAHQAPFALSALSLCLRPMMFPHPAALCFLPVLLPLLLPGIDSSDSTKSSAALQVITQIFSWMAIRSSYIKKENNTAVSNSSVSLSDRPGQRQLMLYEDPAHPPYTTIPSLSATPDLGVRDMLVDLEALAGVFPEWLPAFLDRLFLLLDAQEERQKGQASSVLSGAMCECSFQVLQAIDCPVLRRLVTDKLLARLTQTTPVHAAKTAAKLIEFIVASDPASHPPAALISDKERPVGGVLRSVLLQLMAGDVCVPGKVSPAKLAFRLRLIGGAVRGAGVAQIGSCLDLLEPLTCTALVHHTDKAVRKAVNKLAKVRQSIRIFCCMTYAIYYIRHSLTEITI